MDFPRISKTEFRILRLLRDGREKFGLEMVKASSGALKRGTIYVTLGRMEEKGLVASHQETSPGQPGLPRRMYRISAAGCRAFDIYEMASLGNVSFGSEVSYG